MKLIYICTNKGTSSRYLLRPWTSYKLDWWHTAASTSHLRNFAFSFASNPKPMIFLGEILAIFQCQPDRSRSSTVHPNSGEGWTGLSNADTPPRNENKRVAARQKVFKTAEKSTKHDGQQKGRFLSIQGFEFSVKIL